MRSRYSHDRECQNAMFRRERELLLRREPKKTFLGYVGDWRDMIRLRDPKLNRTTATFLLSAQAFAIGGAAAQRLTVDF
jgi:hypothetical protein